MEKTKKWDWAKWWTIDQRSYFRGEKCSECDMKAYYLAIAEDDGADGDTEVIRARCREHFNPLTQKTWLKRWRMNNVKD